MLQLPFFLGNLEQLLGHQGQIENELHDPKVSGNMPSLLSIGPLNP